MHETSMIKDIIEKAKKQGNVKSITIEVGELANIKANHLKEHLEAFVDWEIKTVEKPAITECECGFKGKPKIITRGHDFVLFTCPWCNDVPKIKQGDKIVLKEVKCV
ncbi:MAG: hydrogenase nickel incorporation protein HypA [Candidatus Woesearchaeota archaeon]|nr:hydrogenase nickel incorporation protein HypA [Candidatus Woesearchaeota archaeon]